MTTTGFASGLIAFHPTMQPGMSFRFLGRQSVAGHTACVIGFAQRPDVSPALGSFHISLANKSVSLYLQGIAWISADQHQVLRLRSDLLHPISEINLARETSEIDYRPYRFLSSPKTFFLPSHVTVSVEWGHKRLRNEHIFSKFRLFKVDAHSEERSGTSNRGETTEKSLPN